MGDTVGLQVLICGGRDEIPQVETAVRIALAAASCGHGVRIFLSGAAGIWACRQPGEGPEVGVLQLMEQLTQVGGVVECCSVCAEELCSGAGPMAEWGGMRDEVIPTGLVTFANRAAKGVATLTF